MKDVSLKNSRHWIKLGLRALNMYINQSDNTNNLVENGYDMNITSDNGNIKILLKEYVIRFDNIKEKMFKLVNPVPGVKNVEVIMGSDVHVPSRYDELEAHPRFLLVDDEKEYVQTLSDRLQTRDLDSAIAYDGEEALSHIEKDVKV